MIKTLFFAVLFLTLFLQIGLTEDTTTTTVSPNDSSTTTTTKSGTSDTTTTSASGSTTSTTVSPNDSSTTTTTKSGTSDTTTTSTSGSTTTKVSDSTTTTKASESTTTTTKSGSGDGTSTTTTTKSCTSEWTLSTVNTQCNLCNCYSGECRTQSSITDSDISTIKNLCQLSCDKAYWKWPSSATSETCCPTCSETSTTSTSTSKEPNVWTTQTCEWDKGYEWKYNSDTKSCQFYYCDDPSSCRICDGSVSSSDSEDQFWVEKYCDLSHCSTWSWPTPTTSTVGDTTYYGCGCPECKDSTPYVTKDGGCTNEYTLEWITDVEHSTKTCELCYCYDSSTTVNQCWNVLSDDMEIEWTIDLVYKICPEIADCSSELEWSGDCECPTCYDYENTDDGDYSSTVAEGTKDGTEKGQQSNSYMIRSYLFVILIVIFSIVM